MFYKGETLIRAILVVFFFFAFFFFGIPVVGVLFIVRHFNRDASLYATWKIIRTFLKFELWVSATKVEAEGIENIPDDEPCLFVGNHQSYYDVLSTYVCLKRPTGYIAKKSISGIPVMGWWMILMNCLFLDRKDVKQGLRVIMQAIEYVKQGCSIFIFPEGTRNKNADKTELNEFKEGSLKIAQRTGCPVVPVAISGTADVYENHRPFVKPATVKVHFLPPFRIADLEGDDRKKPAAYTRRLIMADLRKGREDSINSAEAAAGIKDSSADSSAEHSVESIPGSGAENIPEKAAKTG